MNELRLTGKVLNCYVHETTGALITKVAVMHEHFVNKQSFSCESVFNTIMLDGEKIRHADWEKGDTVLITGYIKVDHKQSMTGNEHQSLKVYATNIEVTKPKVQRPF